MPDDKPQPGFSLSLTTDLGKVAEMVVNKLSDAAGVFYEPRRIINNAIANAEAERILAKSKRMIELDDLQFRTCNRLLFEEAKKQENIDAVIQKALPDISEDADPSKMDNDWIALLLDKVKLVSDEEMQSLWSRILAGEANEPGKFSKRTINFLASMDKRDAEMFTKLCAFAFYIDGFIPLIVDIKNDIYKRHAVNFGVLKHLESIGLVGFPGIGNFTRSIDKSKPQTVYYHESSFIIDIEQAEMLDVGQATFSQVGAELATIVDIDPVPEILDHVLQYWSRNYKIYSDWPRKE